MATVLVTDERSALLAAKTASFPAWSSRNVGAGSRDTYRVVDGDELLDVCRSLLSVGPPCEYVVEACIPGVSVDPPWGDFVSVESAVRSGRVSHLGVTGKFAWLPRSGNGRLPAGAAKWLGRGGDLPDRPARDCRLESSAGCATPKSRCPRPARWSSRSMAGWAGMSTTCFFAGTVRTS